MTYFQKKSSNDWKADFESVELTEEEIKAALLEGKKKKWFHEKNKEYWDNQERPKVKELLKQKNV